MWRQEQDWLLDSSAAWPSSIGTSRWLLKKSSTGTSRWLSPWWSSLWSFSAWFRGSGHDTNHNELVYGDVLRIWFRKVVIFRYLGFGERTLSSWVMGQQFSPQTTDFRWLRRWRFLSLSLVLNCGWVGIKSHKLLVKDSFNVNIAYLTILSQIFVLWKILGQSSKSIFWNLPY